MADAGAGGADALEARLERRLEAVRAEVDRRIEGVLFSDGRDGRCPALPLARVQDAVRQALVARPGLEDVGWGHQVLARVWPTDRPAEPEPDPADRAQPEVALAFAARLDDAVVVAVGVSTTTKPSPGTTWSQLGPWREGLKPATVERKLRAWAEAVTPAERVPLDAARAWVTRPVAEPERPLDERDRPTPKQLDFLASLKEQKGLDDDGLGAILREHAGVERLDRLERRAASAVIDALLELPNPKKNKKRKAAAKKPKQPSGPKLRWRGRVRAVEPRIKLSRAADGEDQHGYAGYALFLEGTVGEEERPFSVGIGKAAQAKHGFQKGDTVSGAAVPVLDPAREPTELYKASALKVEERDPPEPGEPPWLGPPPDLKTYRAAGHRDLPEDAYAAEPCASCIYAARLPVEDRATGEPEGFQTVCYGPGDCPAYSPF